MTGKKNVHGFLEKSGLPLLIVIAIPLGLIAFAIWGTGAATPAPTSSANVAPIPTQTASISGTIALDDPAALPTSISSTGELVPFSFSIQNTSAAAEQLQYKVSVLWSTGENDVIDENIASLAAGQLTTVNELLKFEIATETAEVTLSLPQVGQSSQFALPATQ